MATDFIDKLTFLSHPSGKGQGKHHIVIVGAGIIGVCTAYYLTKHPDFHPSTHHITILESKRVAGGASGKAGGLLASWAFPQQIVPLSFQLHQDLSDEYDGGNNWDYRRLTTVSLEADVQNVPIDDTEEPVGSSYSSSCSSGLDKKQSYGLKVPAPKKKKLSTNSSPSFLSTSSASIGSGEGANDYDYDAEIEDETSDSFSKPSSRFHSVINLDSLNTNTNNTNNNSNNNHNNDAKKLSTDDDDILLKQTQQLIDEADEDDDEDENLLSAGDMTHSRLSNEKPTISSTYPLSEPSVPLPVDLNWIKKQLVKDWSSLGGTDSTAQVHPYKFTHYLLLKAMESEAVDLILGKVTKIQYNSMGICCGISYSPTTDNEKSSAISSDAIVDISDAQQVVLAMGPWTSKILPDCPISGLRAHSITIKPRTGTVSPYAIFTELKIGKNQYFSPEMYARKDEVYVCGEGDTLVDLPETSDAVEVVREKCDELYHYVSKLSKNLSSGHILKRQACYLPVLNVPTSSGPLVGETNVEGLYIASGHSCWGINNAPGTGKVMSELLLEGEAKSAEISGLDPSLYFDARVLD